VDVIEVTLNVVTVFLSNLLVWCPSSILAPRLFIMHTTPDSTLISSLSLNHQLHADDTQIFFYQHDLDLSITRQTDARHNAVSETLRYQKSMCVKTTTQGHQRSLMILPIFYYLENIKHRIRKSKHTGSLLWSLRHIITISFCRNLHSTSTYGT